MPIEVSMTTEQMVRITATAVTSAMHPASLMGPVLFMLGGSGDCTLTPIDAWHTWVVAGSSLNDTILTAMAHTGFGSVFSTTTDTATIHVHRPLATSLVLSADAPVFKL